MRVEVFAKVLVIAVAAAVRFRPYPNQFVDGVLLPVSNDASYHMRRILRITQDFSYPGLFDPLFNWPHGAATHWSPGFDYIAAVVSALVAGNDPSSIAQVAALLPAIYGVMAVVLVGHLSTRVLAKGDGFVWATAALFAALLPQNVAISRVGFVDHHVTEVLFTALLWRWTVASTELAEVSAGLKERVRFEIMGSLLLTASVWVQSVGLLYAGIATTALVALVFTRRSAMASVPRGLVGTGAPALGLSAILLALLYAPAVREHGHRYAYEFPSYFQPILLAVGGLTVAIAWLLAQKLRRRAKRGAAARPLGALLLAVPLALATLVALVPAVRGALFGLFQFAATEGSDLAKIEELQPLLSAASTVDGTHWSRVDAFFGSAGRALFALLPVGLLAAWRAGKERWVGVVVWTLVLLALSLAQNRWSRVLLVPIAVVSALALRLIADWLLRAVGRRWRRPAPGLARWSSVCAGTTGLVTAGILLMEPEPIGAFTRPPPLAVSVFEAGLFLREVAPQEEGLGQRRGMLAPWNYGFQLMYTSGLPVLSTGHAWLVGEDGYRLERAAWRGSAAALWSLMDERQLRFVVAGSANLARVKTADGERSLRREAGGQAFNWDYFKAVPLGVMVLGGTGLPELGVRHLEHLCPRFVSSQFLPMQVPVPRLWVFEWVRGAVLEGSAAPGSRVVAELQLQHAAGVVPYIAFADADERGAFAIRLPVPTGMATRRLRSEKMVQLRRQGEAVVSFAVSEEAVRAGATVAVPAGDGSGRSRDR